MASRIMSGWTGSFRIKDVDKFRNPFPSPKRWPRYNEIIQPPQDGVQRPATYYHYRENIKYSPKKFWYTAKFIRGMNIDEAIKQCKFLPYKGAQIAAQVLEEAQEIAVRDHNFECKSNMWVEEAIVGKGLVLKGTRKHARMRFGEVRYFYTHLMVKLVEGEAPIHYYKPAKDGNDLLKDYYDNLRSRNILQGMNQ